MNPAQPTPAVRAAEELHRQQDELGYLSVDETAAIIDAHVPQPDIKAWIAECREKFNLPLGAEKKPDKWWTGYSAALEDFEKFAEGLDPVRSSAHVPAEARDIIRQFMDASLHSAESDEMLNRRINGEVWNERLKGEFRTILRARAFLDGGTALPPESHSERVLPTSGVTAPEPTPKPSESLAEASTEAHGWRPIETAPKGHVVDCHNGSQRFTNCQWSAPDGCWKFRARDGGLYDTEATHWQPLPEPPQALAAEEGGES